MKIEIDKGMSIYRAAEDAIYNAKVNHCEVEFDFNDIPMRVTRWSFADDIATIYYLKNQIEMLLRSLKKS